MPERTGAMTLSKRRIVVNLPEAAGSRGIIRSWLAHEGVHAMAGQKQVPRLSARVEPFDPRRGLISRLFGPRLGTPSERAVFKSVRRKLQSEARKPYALRLRPLAATVKQVRRWDDAARRGIQRVFGTKVGRVSIRTPEWIQKRVGPASGFHQSAKVMSTGAKSGAYVAREGFPPFHVKHVTIHEQVHALVAKNKRLATKVPGGRFEDYPALRSETIRGPSGKLGAFRLGKLLAEQNRLEAPSRAIFKSIRRKIQRAGRYQLQSYMVSPTLVTSERGVRCLRPARKRRKKRIRVDGCR